MGDTLDTVMPLLVDFLKTKFDSTKDNFVTPFYDLLDRIAVPVGNAYGTAITGAVKADRMDESRTPVRVLLSILYPDFAESIQLKAEDVNVDRYCITYNTIFGPSPRAISRVKFEVLWPLCLCLNAHKFLGVKGRISDDVLNMAIRYIRILVLAIELPITKNAEDSSNAGVSALLAMLKFALHENKKLLSAVTTQSAEFLTTCFYRTYLACLYSDTKAGIGDTLLSPTINCLTGKIAATGLFEDRQKILMQLQQGADASAAKPGIGFEDSDQEDLESDAEALPPSRTKKTKGGVSKDTKSKQSKLAKAKSLKRGILTNLEPEPSKDTATDEE